MAFEKITLDIVAKVLKRKQSAEFYNGTLFIDANQKEAVRIRNYFRSECNTRVLMSEVGNSGNKFAIDFI
jgi:hypothetical protein